MPYSQYLKLEECWSKIKSERNMTIVNNTVGIPIWHTILLPVTVVTVPHDLHEGPALAFERMIMNGAEDYLSSHGSDGSLIARIVNFDLLP
ncbi:hypothetical protein V1505DRAFT_367470 [Lipomyces doorenjongii]